MKTTKIIPGKTMPIGPLVRTAPESKRFNNNGKPLYGCEIIGKQWNFVILQGKNYCISKMYDCTEKEELLKIIAILRKFRHILETELLD